ncbi:peptidoglycan/LPS O-acetylase OafA/YrhL [Chryseobacterium shigense]|uniref:Peptidoglycan/LPS O-acetylase OafA/YrhL n=2 Tax=Chryseobacterium shigense TaxID=297244 RepID=A0A841N555_9FLAO|nr:peptidoglycan/LPS O-acetylase OafA/YrhL [Chryseobacterium shigense]
MTRIILSGFKNDNFNLLDFYKKRVVRIFPALLVMITFFAVVIYFLLPTMFSTYLKSYFSSSLFFSNIYYYLNNGYFDQQSQFNFLLHTWSLSVEWQFYMIYPLILLLFRHTYQSRKKVFIVYFCALIGISFASMLIHSAYDKSYSFFIFYTRAWEMMIGGVAFLFEDKVKAITFNTKLLVVSICIVILGVFIVTTNEHSITWPSTLTIIPVVSTMVILLLNIDLKIFNNKVINFLGNISYSLYLWHWPFYVLSIFFNVNERFRYRILFIALSFVFAIVSYYFVEKRNYNKKYKLVLVSTVILFASSLIITKVKPHYIFDNYKANMAFAATDYKYSPQAYKQYDLKNKHFSYNLSLKNYDLNKIKVLPQKKNIVLLGDSHAGMFSQTFHNIFPQDKYNLIQVTADATYPMINSKTRYQGPKDFFNYFFQDFFPKNYSKIDMVVINSNYADYTKDEISESVEFTENYFKKYNTKVLYIGQTSTFYLDFPTSYYLKNHFNIDHKNNRSIKEKDDKTNDLLISKLGDKYINILHLKIKEVSNHGEPYIYDTGHLSYYGTEQYRSFLANKLK